MEVFRPEIEKSKVWSTTWAIIKIALIIIILYLVIHGALHIMMKRKRPWYDTYEKWKEECGRPATWLPFEGGNNYEVEKEEVDTLLELSNTPISRGEVPETIHPDYVPGKWYSEVSQKAVDDLNRNGTVASEDIITPLDRNLRSQTCYSVCRGDGNIMGKTIFEKFPDEEWT
jgi:hypothetical protein